MVVKYLRSNGNYEGETEMSFMFYCTQILTQSVRKITVKIRRYIQVELQYESLLISRFCAEEYHDTVGTMFEIFTSYK